MGFGGINTHVVARARRRQARAAPASTRARPGWSRSRQDGELLLLDAASTADLRGRVASLAALVRPSRLRRARRPGRDAGRRSSAAGRCARRSSPRPRRRPQSGFAALLELLDGGASTAIDVAGGRVPRPRGRDRPGSVSCSPARAPAAGTDGGALRRRFAAVRRALPGASAARRTATWSPPPSRSRASSPPRSRACGCWPCSASRPTAAVGHSLGELTALHWAGAMDEAGAAGPGRRARPGHGRRQRGGGAMASIAAGPDAGRAAAARDGTAAERGGHRRLQRPAADRHLRAGRRRSTGCAARRPQAAWTTMPDPRSRTPSTPPLVAPAAAGLRALPGRRCEFQPLARPRPVHRHR